MRLPWKKSKMGTGWLRDPEDKRDRVFFAMPRTEDPPESVDLSRHVPTILDQGNTSSCVAHAFAYAIAIAESQSHLPYDPISRLFLYSNARALTGDDRRDDGTYLRSAARALQVLGAAPESAMPFRPGRINDRPQIDAMMLAHPRRNGVYRRVMGSGLGRIHQIKRGLEAGHAITFGAEVTARFISHTSDDVVEAPEQGEPIVGGHAMCAVGYSPDGLRIVNSWSASWGEGGFATLSWEYVGGEFCDDWWVVTGWDRLREAFNMKHAGKADAPSYAGPERRAAQDDPLGLRK